MSITIGRAGVGFTNGLVVSSFDANGDTARVQGWIRDQSSLADVTALRDQLNGLAGNTDEPVVPVIWTEDGSVDGFYRVGRVSVGSEPRTRLNTNSVLPYTVELEKVPGWQAPLFEVLSRGALRTNSHSITNGGVTAWVGYTGDTDVGDAKFYAYDANATMANETGPIGADGYRVAYMYGLGAPASFFDNSLLSTVSATYAYVSSCAIEYSADGSSWRSLVGRQVPDDVQNLRIHNQLARVTWTGSKANSDPETFMFEAWNNSESEWQSQEFAMSEGFLSALDPSSPVILRNSPEAVAIQIEGFKGSTRTSVSLSLARRQHFVVGYQHSTGNNASRAYGIHDSANAAGTNLGTYGVERTTADANGNKWRIMSPDAVTQHSTNGIYLTTPAASFSFAAGLDLNEYSAAATTDVELYFAAMDHRQQIVAR